MNLRKSIATFLVGVARWLYKDEEVEYVEHYEHRKLGVGYHISKKDVVRFRKENPQYGSHREGLKALIEDTKQIVLGSITAGIRENGLVDYEVRKSFWTADVIGTLNVYVPASKEINDTCPDGGEEEG